MNQKLLIVFFSTILYNGVTYSSPANEQVSVSKLLEEKLPENSSMMEGIKKKVELALVNSTDHIVSGTQSTSNDKSLQHTENTTTLQSTSAISNLTDKNITVHSSDEMVKIGNQDSVIKNISKVVDNKTSSHNVENKNVTSDSSDDVSASENSATPVSINTISTTTFITSTVSVKTTIKPTVSSTVAPTPALTTKVVTGQNTPAPAQEKHFDGPSFIGGIVLTIGLTAIGFIAFKYYKSGKIDMNYRTL